MASLDLQSEKGVNGFSSSRDSEIAALISSLKSSLPGDGSPNSYDREKLKDVAHKLSLVLETPGETVLRVAYLVSWSDLHFPLHLNGMKTRL